MDDKRNKRKRYRRQWMSEKRAKMRLSRKNKHQQFVSSESEDGSPAPVMNKLCHSFSSEQETIETVCNSETDSSSNDFTTEKAWDFLDELCDKDSSSACSDSDEEIDTYDIQSDLRAWVVDCNVTQAQVNKLLPIMRKFDSCIPLSAKTLMKLPENEAMKTRTVSGGDYMYFGVLNGLNSVYSANSTAFTNIANIELAFNVDGVPLFHSSSYSLWPILCYATNVSPNQVFVVAVYGGKSKPCDLKFLEETIDELNKMVAEGVAVQGDSLVLTTDAMPPKSKELGIVLKFCVCDAPARSMVKGIKQFSGYYGCDKCVQKGKYIGRNTYPECEAKLRTDQSFRMQSNVEHHHHVSPFSNLPVDMITFFPLDFLHQVCLGVMKRLLVCWTAGSKKVKLSSAQKLQINSRLQTFRAIVTTDFNRKPRSLSELAHWKATEFRTFLLYSGYLIMRKIAKDDIVQHFLCLSVAMSILVSEKLSKSTDNREYAHRLLLHFVEKAAALYGPEFLVYNVHSLTHFSREAELFGPLDKSSAFIFENFMQQLKKSVKSARNPVLQVARRLQEKNNFSNQSVGELKLESFLEDYSCQPPDNNCMLADGRCCQVISIAKEHVRCMVFLNTEPLYSTPCDSRIIGVHKARLSSGVLKHFPSKTIAHKAMCYTDYEHSEIVFMVLLHNV